MEVAAIPALDMADDVPVTPGQQLDLRAIGPAGNGEDRRFQDPHACSPSPRALQKPSPWPNHRPTPGISERIKKPHP